MRQCRVCGRKGLFVRINKQGRCEKCEEKYQVEQQNIAKEREEALPITRLYYKQIVEKANIIVSDIHTDSDNPISMLKNLHEVDERMKTCDDLLKLLDEYKNYKYMDEVLEENIVSMDKWGNRKIEPFDCTMWDNPLSVDGVFSSLSASCRTYKKGWERMHKRIENFAQFQETMSNIKKYSFTVSKTLSSPRRIKDIPEWKTTNITSSSNYEKLGSFISVDVETTGLNGGADRIIEFAAIRFEDWIPVEKFQTLVQPGKHIPVSASNVSNIDDEMVKDAPLFAQLVPEIEKFMGKYNLVGHNLPFDIKFLYAGGVNIFACKRKYYDTLKLARSTYKDMEKYSLDYLCDQFDIRDNESAHRALSDCLATAELFHKIAFRRTNL